MITFRNSSCLFIVMIFVGYCQFLAGQTASAMKSPASIIVSMSVDKDSVPAGQSPWAILTVRNLTGQQMVLHDHMYHIHVDGENGEAPMTYVQRGLTGKLDPGEAALPGGEGVLQPTLPHESAIRKFLLSYYYNLSSPGRYTVYADVEDPSSEKWLRTNIVTFRILAPKN